MTKMWLECKISTNTAIQQQQQRQQRQQRQQQNIV